jgi:hypothetical protein
VAEDLHDYTLVDALGEQEGGRGVPSVVNPHIPNTGRFEQGGLAVTAYHLVGVYSDPDHVFAHSDGEVRQEFSVCFAC